MTGDTLPSMFPGRLTLVPIPTAEDDPEVTFALRTTEQFETVQSIRTYPNLGLIVVEPRLVGPDGHGSAGQRLHLLHSVPDGIPLQLDRIPSPHVLLPHHRSQVSGWRTLGEDVYQKIRR